MLPCWPPQSMSSVFVTAWIGWIKNTTSEYFRTNLIFFSYIPAMPKNWIIRSPSIPYNLSRSLDNSPPKWMTTLMNDRKLYPQTHTNEVALLIGRKIHRISFTGFSSRAPESSCGTIRPANRIHCQFPWITWNGNKRKKENSWKIAQCIVIFPLRRHNSQNWHSSQVDWSQSERGW